MVTRRVIPPSIPGARPTLGLGVAVALIALTAETLIVYPLAHLVSVSALAVVYLPGVLIVATYWDIALGVAAAGASALTYNFFHLRPVGLFTLGDSRTWVALAAFLLVAVCCGYPAQQARVRAAEAEQRRSEADFATEIARVLLGGTRIDVALAVTAQRLASAFGFGSAAIELGDVVIDQRRTGFALRDPGSQSTIGTLVLPATLSVAERRRIEARVVPTLQSILAAALHRVELQAEVAESTALRRGDEMKTAVLRSVSHDLRTPLTAILTAATALDPATADAAEAAEAQAVVVAAATRLSGLVEKLLDLSRLQAGNLEGREVPCSLEDVLHEAREATESAFEGARFRLTLDDELPLLSADPGQLERAFANLFENAARYANGKPVAVRAQRIGDRLRVRIVDQGPGIRASELERIFLPFYRSPHEQPGHQGSGLGLAIARGFIEVNGGSIAVESLPGQGTSFSVELPLAPKPEAESAARARAGAGAGTGTARAKPRRPRNSGAART
jgi:two-component system sensor histidine kinase KdpD